MANLEDLIAEVENAKLRRALEREVQELKRRKRFGLVFEEHIPEVCALPNVPVEERAVVRDRTEAAGALYRVHSIKEDMARIAPLGAERDVTERALRDLHVVKRFGEAIYTALTPLGTRANGKARPWHAVINGENFHALQMLLYLYEGQVDCIYIDPPYNTGARDWKYNNRYVDEADSWRHSKWLAFMQKRLALAKRLLKPREGVLICTIDEHEVHHLGMLLESLFSDYATYMVTIVHNPKGTYKKNFARVDERAFFCIPRDHEAIAKMPLEAFAQSEDPEKMRLIGERSTETEDLYLRRRGQESGYRHQRPNSFYAILVDEQKKAVVGLGPPLGPDSPYRIAKKGSVVTVYPLDTRGDERVWRYTHERMRQLIEAGEIIVSGYSRRAKQGWVLNHRVVRKSERRLKTVWWERRHDAGTHGSDLLTAYLGESARFPFPKSVYAVRDCLDAVVRNRPDALIVDFFAGSGTTLHATALLNARDGSRRRCIMVTNNEVDGDTARRLHHRGLYQGDPEFEKHGIFEAVTRPRCDALITGRRADGTPVEGEHVWADRRPYAQGFPENVEYFQLTYLDPNEVDLGWQFRAVLPALWLRAGGIGRRPQGRSGPMLISKRTNMAVLFDESRIRDFAGALEQRPDVTHVYLVTDSTEAFAEMRALLPGGLDVSMLYRDYLRNFEINTGVRP